MYRHVRVLALAGVLAAGLATAAGAAPATAGTAPPKWIHIAAGPNYTCGIREGNTLWCWGANFWGTLGNGQTANANLPQQITRKSAGWTSVTAGEDHGCATRTDGGLWCWGNNFSGQLGNGSTNTLQNLPPQQVTSPAADGWARVAAGDEFTCAVRSDSTLWCWGYNGGGELGIGSFGGNQFLPQQVTSPAAGGWASITITASGGSACAVRTDTTLWCWGGNGDGQLGIGSTGNQDQPHQVTSPAAAGWSSADAGAGGDDTCAVRADTTLWCWGSNFDGQLGIGSTTSQHLPQQVTSPAAGGWTSVAAGGTHTCATRIHALWCWGDNHLGQLGSGGPNRQLLPRRVQLPSRTGWSIVAAGLQHACATHTGHTLWCWGYNFHGQLGLGTNTDQRLPQQVTS
jgi:alpha-tubulin suppressor-like RCC1 family protein